MVLKVHKSSLLRKATTTVRDLIAVHNVHPMYTHVVLFIFDYASQYNYNIIR